MRSQDLFSYQSYKNYLHDRLAASVPARGARARLAEAMGSQPAYVSSVLNGSAHFTAEQAEALNEYFGHSETEANFFLILLLWERAGTPALKGRLKAQIDKAREEKFNLKARLPAAPDLSEAGQRVYYSEWYYAAIHTLVSIPAYARPESIAEALRLDRKIVGEVLKFLVEHGLVVFARGIYRIGTARVHLSGSSPYVSRHHANWRLKGLAAIAEKRPDSLHYSSVITLSESDAVLIHEKLVGHIKEIKEIVRASPEEKLMSFNLDFFRVGP